MYQEDYNGSQHYNQAYNYFHHLQSAYYFNRAYNLSLPKSNTDSLSEEFVQETPLNLSIGCNLMNEEHDSFSEDSPIDYSLPKKSNICSDIEKSPIMSVLSNTEITSRLRSVSNNESDDSIDLEIDEEPKDYTNQTLSHDQNPSDKIKTKNRNEVKCSNTTKSKENIDQCDEVVEPTSSSDPIEPEQSLLSAHSILIQKYQKQIIERNLLKYNKIRRENHSIYSKFHERCESTKDYSNFHRRISKPDRDDNTGNSKLFELFKYGRIKSSPSYKDWYNLYSRGSFRKCLIAKRKQQYKQDRKLFNPPLLRNCEHTHPKTPFSAEYSIQSIKSEIDPVERRSNQCPLKHNDPRIKTNRNDDHSYFKKVPEGEHGYVSLEESKFTSCRVAKNGKKQYKRCSLCLNHGIITKMRGHIGNCQFQFCKCNRCLITKARQLHMLRQQRLSRQILREKKCSDAKKKPAINQN